MAHTCPICDCLCHCNGDIDDIDLGHEPRGGCVHFKYANCDDYDDEDDDWLEENAFDDEGLLVQKYHGAIEPETSKSTPETPAPVNNR